MNKHSASHYRLRPTKYRKSENGLKDMLDLPPSLTKKSEGSPLPRGCWNSSATKSILRMDRKTPATARKTSTMTSILGVPRGLPMSAQYGPQYAGPVIRRWPFIQRLH